MSAESNTFRYLQKRAKFLQNARSFFGKREILEFDSPLISKTPSIDAHIDIFSVHSQVYPEKYLISSPEYAMKKALSHGSQDIYFLGHVFRDEPSGRNHSFEFLFAEWYRLGFSFQQMIDETAEFISSFIGKRAIQKISYREAFLQGIGIDPFQKEDEIRSFATTLPELSKELIASSTHDDLLNFILNLRIEPFFDKKALTVLYHYPPSQAALSKKTTDTLGNTVSERFEIYAEGVELANGYHELNDPKEQRLRFHEENRLREKFGKVTYPLDEEFLQALLLLPDCSGVAVGMDRIFMIQEGQDHIKLKPH